MKSDIFISYAREDSEVARQLFGRLKGKGFRPWLDMENILPGQKWEPAIRNAINESTVFIGLLSTHSLDKRGFVQKEMRLALDVLDRMPESAIYLIPVRIDNCRPEQEMLQQIQWVDLFPDFDEGFERIIDTLRATNLSKQGDGPEEERQYGFALDRIMKLRKLRVGAVSQPPLVEFTLVDDETQAAGFYADLARYVATMHDLEIEFIGLPWTEIIKAAQTGKVDFVLCIFATFHRVPHVDFTAILHRIPIGAVALETQSKIKSVDDLHKPDVSIAVTEGEIGWEYAKLELHLEENSKRFHISREWNVTSMMHLVSSGRVDVALADGLSCHQFCESNVSQNSRCSYLFKDNPIYVCNTGLMLRKGESELRNWLDTNFKLARTHSKLARIEEEILTQYPEVIRRAD